MQDELHRIKNKLNESQEVRRQLNEENKHHLKALDQYKKEVLDSINFNDKVMELLGHIRKEIKHDDFKTMNLNMDEHFYMLHAKVVGVEIRPPEPEHPKGHNQFHRHMVEQRNCVKSGLQLIQDTINKAHRDEQPLLASGQSIDQVFKNYRIQAN